MSDEENRQEQPEGRHHRQIGLDGWGEDAQRRLSESYVVVVGAGAIGGSLALQLAAAGVARLGVVDGDQVVEHGLGGQTVHFTPDAQADAGKADSIAHKVGLLDPSAQCDAFPAFVDQQNAAAIVAGADSVADCSRDGATTLRLAAACGQLKIPLLVGTAAAWQGATLALDPGADLPTAELPQVSGEPALFAPTAAAVAADLAQRALALLSGAGDPGAGVLRRYDGRDGTWITSGPRAGGERQTGAGESAETSG